MVKLPKLCSPFSSYGTVAAPGSGLRPSGARCQCQAAAPALAGGRAGTKEARVDPGRQIRTCCRGPAAAAVRHCKLARTTAAPQSAARVFKFRGQESNEKLSSLAVRRTAAMTGVLAPAGPYCQPECAVPAA